MLTNLLAPVSERLIYMLPLKKKKGWDSRLENCRKRMFKMKSQRGQVCNHNIIIAYTSIIIKSKGWNYKNISLVYLPSFFIKELAKSKCACSIMSPAGKGTINIILTNAASFQIWYIFKFQQNFVNNIFMTGITKSHH